MPSCLLRVATLCLLAAAARAAPCAETAPGVIRDAAGCGVVNPDPKPGESITWTGGCRDGLADGPGTLQWSQGDVRGTTYVGAMSSGKLVGQGVETFTNGARFEGMFVDGRRDGHGVFTWPGGMRYDGAYERGEMTGQGSLTSMGARLEAAFTRGGLSGPGVLVQQQAGAERRLPVDVGDAPQPAALAASAAGGTAAFARISDFRTCRPEYPPMALRARAVGTTTLALFVDTDGHVQHARLVHASGTDFTHGLLDLSALVSLASCAIAPARIDGQAVQDWLRIDFRWVLD